MVQQNISILKFSNLEINSTYDECITSNSDNVYYVK